MPDLDELKAKLADVIVDDSFQLEERTPAQLLEFVDQYTNLVRFASDDNSLWSDFWFTNITAQQLSDIYLNVALDNKILPVQQTFLLLLLGLLETPKLLLNTVPDRHRTLYYQQLLGFKTGAIKPDTVAVSFNLKSNSKAFLLPAGTLLDAGQDAAGNNITYQTDADVLINHQLLNSLCWTTQDASGNWQLMTALDVDNNIALPDGGIRLFGEADSMETLQRNVVIDAALIRLSGDISVTVFSGDVTRSASEITPILSLQGQQQTPLVFRATRASGGELLYRLPSTLLQKDWHQDAIARTNASLQLKFPAGKAAALPTSYSVTISQSQEIGYIPQEGQGYIDSFSYPFGSQPVLGSSFELTLPTAFIETGGTLTISPQWASLPTENFALWYARYSNPPADNTVFMANLYLVQPSGEMTLLGEQSLFSGSAAPQMQPLTVTLPDDLDADSGDYSIRVELSGSDFHHQEWANDPAGKNAPWTPQVSRIDTQFSQTFTLAQILDRSVLLRDGDVMQQVIYVGLSNVADGDSISIYWDLQSLVALPLTWYYTTGEGVWQALDATLNDGTQGLFISGLWQAILPGDAGTGGDGLSEDYFWLKGVPTTSINTDDVPKVRDLFTNAATATLNLSGDVDSSHFDQPLPAGSISQLVSPLVQISSISQTRPSVGGQARETTAELFERAAGRIATRHRAITWQDMRHMLLDQYPELYDIHFLDVSKLLTIPALTEQVLVVIPGSNASDNDDTLRPALSAGRLQKMGEWLKQFTSPWANPELINPIYVNVIARYQVTFLDDVNPNYGYQQLSEWLQQRYMPWGSDVKQVVAPGNQIDYYQLLATIQQHPLVKNVVALELVDESGATHQETIVAKENEVLILTPQVKA
ncbi:hypothetical protein AAEY27_00455 [Kosakonia sp. BYX6]|uniref:Baseplate protein J-like domain-containing protein n=1 Tax=Kosakonia calanthes TaxID=3139408 RepID=A0ABZ3BB26_9ENTR